MCGGTTTKKASDSTARPNRLHTHTHLPKRLAHPRSPMPPLSTLTARANARAPTSPRSTGLCSIMGLYLFEFEFGSSSDAHDTNLAIDRSEA